MASNCYLADMKLRSLITVFSFPTLFLKSIVREEGMSYFYLCCCFLVTFFEYYTCAWLWSVKLLSDINWCF